MEQKLGFYETLAICVGAIMTTAIFSLPALIYEEAGYASVHIWAAAALISVFMGLCFAELAGITAQSGGPFIYVRKAFGDFLAFVTGWSMWLYSVAAIAMLAIITSNYAAFFFPMDHWQIAALSIAVLGIFTLINIRGVKEGARAEVLLILLAVAIYVAYVVIGLPHADISRLVPALTGFSGMLLVLAMEPFVGWETPIVISEEVKDPRKTLPKAIIITTVFTVALNFSLVLVFLGNVEGGAAATLASVATKFGPGFVEFFMAAAVLIGFSALNSWILSVARLPAAMAKRRLFLLSFEKTNSRGAPTRSLLLQFGFASLLCMFGQLEHVVTLLLSIAFIMYAITFAALIRLRKTKEGAERTLKLPLLFPVIGIIASVFLMLSEDPSVMLLGALLLATGLPAFIMVKLLTDKRFVEKFWDAVSFVWQFYWPVFVYRPKRLERVINLAHIRDGQTILDHGAGTGLTTIELSRRFPRARIVADDISRAQIERAVRLFKNLPSLSNVIFVKTKGGVPYPERAFDRIICVLAINYFVHPEKDMIRLHRVLKKNGRAIFLAVRAPFIISHTFLNTDMGIKSVMRGAGFRNISVERERKLLREYIYITAAK
ncbi:MAG: amino acid permease [Candidatus Aenigmatarchaeota archaeon]